MATDKETNEMLKKFWDANQDLIRAAIDAFVSSEEDDTNEVKDLKDAFDNFTNTRDYTKYSIDGNGSYNKRQLVEEVVKHIISSNGNVMGTLQNLHDKCTNGLFRGKDSYDKDRAFKVEYNGDPIYITNQWGIGNIPSFIDAVNFDNTIDITIEAINK